MKRFGKKCAYFDNPQLLKGLNVYGSLHTCFASYMFEFFGLLLHGLCRHVLVLMTAYYTYNLAICMTYGGKRKKFKIGKFLNPGVSLCGPLLGCK